MTPAQVHHVLFHQRDKQGRLEMPKDRVVQPVKPVVIADFAADLKDTRRLIAAVQPKLENALDVVGKVCKKWGVSEEERAAALDGIKRMTHYASDESERPAGEGRHPRSTARRKRHPREE